MNKDLYHIILFGCDDKTEIEMELTQEEAELIRQVSALTIEESDYCCMPTLAIIKAKKENINEER